MQRTYVKCNRCIEMMHLKNNAHKVGKRKMNNWHTAICDYLINLVYIKCNRSLPIMVDRLMRTVRLLDESLQNLTYFTFLIGFSVLLTINTSYHRYKLTQETRLLGATNVERCGPNYTLVGMNILSPRLPLSHRRVPLDRLVSSYVQIATTALHLSAAWTRYLHNAVLENRICTFHLFTPIFFLLVNLLVFFFCLLARLNYPIDNF